MKKELQEACTTGEEEAKTSGHRRTGMGKNAWLRDVAEGLRSGPKTMLGPGRRCLLPASESYVAPSLQCEREIFARVQARTTLQKKHLGERCLRRYTETTTNAKTVDGTTI
jgi:hypothetical protein